MANTGLNYRISGQGNPVVFLHGFMEDNSMWDQLISALPIKACCIELPGHGQSVLDEHEYPSIENMALKVSEIIQLEGFETSVIVGHSMGGYVGLELLNKTPTIEHLVLFHSHPWEDSEEKKKDRERVAELVQTKAAVFIREAIPNLFFQKEIHPDAIEKYITIADKMNPKAIAWASLAMKNRLDFSSNLIQHPEKYSLISGEKDKLINVELLASFCKENNISNVTIPAIGHMGHEENSEEVLKLLKTIL
jgi:pimeloyl-ACP methyl ester carboxylesterase